MVVALVILTLVFFVLIDIVLQRREARSGIDTGAERKPIFLTPDKALTRVAANAQRRHHLSHTWAQMGEADTAFVGFDDFVSFILPSTVKVTSLPRVHDRVLQGHKLWDLALNGKRIPQASPVSGEVVEVNPAFGMDIKLPTGEVEHSWILKVRPDNFQSDSLNLARPDMARSLNATLRDEVALIAHDAHFLNDGGVIDTEYLGSMDDERWSAFLHKYFAHG